MVFIGKIVEVLGKCFFILGFYWFDLKDIGLFFFLVLKVCSLFLYDLFFVFFFVVVFGNRKLFCLYFLNNRK